MNIKKMIGGVIVVGTGFPIYTSVHSAMAMDHLISDGLAIFSKTFNVKEMDAGEFSKIRVYGVMPFRVKRYLIERVGNLSVMTVNMGLMQMFTFVVTPLEKDMPLISVDYIYMLSKRKAILEFYDLTADKTDSAYQDILKELKQIMAGYSDLKDVPTAKAWYDDLMTVLVSKTGRIRDDDRLHTLFTECAGCWAKHAALLPDLDEAAKEKKCDLIRDYANDLVDRGGLSTDVFKKCLGVEKTKEFFRKVFFGYDAEK